MKDYVEKEHNTLDKYWWNTYWEVCRKNGSDGWEIVVVLVFHLIKAGNLGGM